MLKKFILLALITLALPARPHDSSQRNESLHNTPFDGYFFYDSLLVIVSGAGYGVAMETACHLITDPHPDRALYCKMFAAGGLAGIYLLRAQRPASVLEAWEKLNMLLVVLASGYIGSTHFQPESVNDLSMSVFCYQMAKITASTAVYCFWEPVPVSQGAGHLNSVIMNGISTGGLIDALALWYTKNLRGRMKSLIPTLASTGTTLLSTALYLVLLKPGSVSTSIFSGALVIIEATAAVYAIAQLGAMYETGPKTVTFIGVLNGALAGAGARVKAAATAGALVAAITGFVIGTGAGYLIMGFTIFSLQMLSIGEHPGSLSHSLAQLVITSLPLLVASWLVSVNQWITNSIPSHESMRHIYFPNAVRALLRGE